MLVPFTDGLLTPVSADVPPSRIISLPRSLNQSSQCVRDSRSRLCEYSSVFSMNVTICGSVAATLFRPSRVILFFGKGIDIGRSGRAAASAALASTPCAPPWSRAHWGVFSRLSRGVLHAMRACGRSDKSRQTLSPPHVHVTSCATPCLCGGDRATDASNFLAVGPFGRVPATEVVNKTHEVDNCAPLRCCAPRVCRHSSPLSPPHFLSAHDRGE